MKRSSKLVALGAGVALALSGVALAGGTGSIASAADGVPPGSAAQPMTSGQARSVLVTNTDQTFHPVTPCRVVDTRTGTGTGHTPFASLATRSYYVSGTFGFAPQGGKSGGCGIPTNATAVAVTMTAVNPTAPGYLRTWPAGGSEPTSTVLNYPTTSSGTGATLALRSGAAQQLTVKNYNGPTDVVIDVQGYYQPPIEASVELDGTLNAGTSRISSTSRTGTGVFRVIPDTNVDNCSATASPDGSGDYNANAVTDSGGITIYTYNAASTPTNIRFTVSVTC